MVPKQHPAIECKKIETKDSPKKPKQTKDLKHKNEGEDSSDDDITLLQMRSKKSKRQRILESDEEDESKHTAKRLTCKVASNFQNKSKVNLDVHGINLRDDIVTNNMFLDDNGEILTNAVPESLPEFVVDTVKGIQYKNEYQEQKENLEQFEFIQKLAISKDNDPSFLKWSEVLEPKWDSPKLCQAAQISDNFMFGLGHV